MFILKKGFNVFFVFFSREKRIVSYLKKKKKVKIFTLAMNHELFLIIHSTGTARHSAQKEQNNSREKKFPEHKEIKTGAENG